MQHVIAFNFAKSAKFPNLGAVDKKCNSGAQVKNVYIRPFHYPEDHGGVKPKELSPL